MKKVQKQNPITVPQKNVLAHKVAQVSLTNPCDALHHNKSKF